MVAHARGIHPASPAARSECIRVLDASLGLDGTVAALKGEKPGALEPPPNPSHAEKGSPLRGPRELTFGEKRQKPL